MLLYSQRCFTIYNIVIEHYKNTGLNFELITNNDIKLQQIVITNNTSKSTITLLEDSSWSNIKKLIDLLVNTSTDVFCSVCKKIINNSIINCTKCAEIFCKDCYAERFRIGFGIFECPYCLFKYGKKLSSKKIVDYYVSKIQK